MAETLDKETNNIAICGGGLVGCLAASYFAKRNFDVTLYESRSDIRKAEIVIGRSINMAMSTRGREALKRIGLEEAICSKGIEMYSRMIHDTKGNTSVIPYGKKSQCILSIDRRLLNELLLTEAEKFPNVTVKFDHKLTSCKTTTGELLFQNTETKENVETYADLIVGADGSYSVVRKCLAREKPMDYLQEYKSGWYSELCIPANEDGNYAMPPNHLHIWPRGDFMLIALPNQDRSFTLTLFMPKEMFDKITTPEELIEFFTKYFVDTIELIGRESLIRNFFNNKPSPLISIKCNFHHGKKCVMFGDSVHSMVPFYGQGMNAAFEDCVEFFEIFDKKNFEDLNEILESYSQLRVPDAHAICDLAVNNYTEMRYLVTTRKYKLRKKLDNFLNVLFPQSWISLYEMVTFSRIRYSEVIQRRKKQDQIISYVGTATASVFFGLVALASFKYIGKNL